MTSKRKYTCRQAAGELDGFDRAILEFAVRWAPFDGGHEFVFAEFGISLADFYDRLRQILKQIGPGREHLALVDAARRNYSFRPKS